MLQENLIDSAKLPKMVEDDRKDHGEDDKNMYHRRRSLDSKKNAATEGADRKREGFDN